MPSTGGILHRWRTTQEKQFGIRIKFSMPVFFNGLVKYNANIFC